MKKKLIHTEDLIFKVVYFMTNLTLTWMTEILKMCEIYEKNLF